MVITKLCKQTYLIRCIDQRRTLRQSCPFPLISYSWSQGKITIWVSFPGMDVAATKMTVRGEVEKRWWLLGILWTGGMGFGAVPGCDQVLSSQVFHFFLHQLETLFSECISPKTTSSEFEFTSQWLFMHTLVSGTQLVRENHFNNTRS